MKKIFNSILTVILVMTVALPLSAQDSRQRTVETMVGDVLAQMPTQTQADFNREMGYLAESAPKSVILLAKMLQPAEKACNNKVEYAISGVVAYATQNAKTREAVKQGIEQSISGAPDQTAKEFLQQQLRLFLTENDVEYTDHTGASPYAAEWDKLVSLGDNAGNEILKSLKSKDHAYRMQALKFTIESNRLTLRNLLGMSESEVLDLATEDGQEKSSAYSLPLLDTVMQRALQNLPDLEICEMDISKAEYNVKMAQAAYMPTLGLNAGMSYYEGQAGQVDGQGTVITHGGMNSSVGLSLNIPILNQGNTRTQIKQNKIELEQAHLQYDQKKVEIEQEIESQYITTQQALNQFKACETMEQAYKASYDVYVMKYAEGAITTVEMFM